MLDLLKTALRITTDEFNVELEHLIDAALIDLGFGGMTNTDTTDPVITQAIITYCKMNFGMPDDYDRLKRSYDEQKAQLGMATGYTDWGVVNV